MRNVWTILAACFWMLLPACSSGGSSNNGNGDAQLFTIPFSALEFIGGDIDNPFFPLRPGMKFVLEGVTEDGFERIEICVTDDTKIILGVECVVVRATEWIDGDKVEETFDWYAQDQAGNVWYFGELSTEFENGVPVGTDGSWEAGVDGAEPGLLMLADPEIGLTYAQESAPGEAEDVGTVVGFDRTVITPLDAFGGVLEIEDSTPLEPGVAEGKFYAPGIGLILEVDEDGSRLELVSAEYNPTFDAQNFGNPGQNPLLPLQPGAKYTYRAETEDGEEIVVVEVLPETKVILGVTCTVVRDIVTLDGEVIEDTFDWFATDNDGNVWYFGEDSTEFEDGVAVSTEGSWEAGVDGAQPGILMFAQPMPGFSYRQEFAEGEAEDMGRAIAFDRQVQVPFGTFLNCLHVEDSTPLEPDVIEDKFYAPGLGLVLEVDEDGIRTELIGVEQN